MTGVWHIMSPTRFPDTPSMSRHPSILITGAGGEMGHGLIERLSRSSDRPIITLDLNPLQSELAGLMATPAEVRHKNRLERYRNLGL